MENFSELVRSNRSYRRFDEAVPVSPEQLREIANLLRNVPCATNRQALKVVAVTSEEKRDKVFPLLGWAALLGDWRGPKKGERPTGYLVIVCDTAIAKPAGRQTDAGIAAQTMALAATYVGFGACILGSFPKGEMAHVLELGANLDPMLVLAIGKPAEKVVLVDIGNDGNTAYYRDRAGTHFVPKRPVNELVIEV